MAEVPAPVRALPVGTVLRLRKTAFDLIPIQAVAHLRDYDQRITILRVMLMMFFDHEYDAAVGFLT